MFTSFTSIRSNPSADLSKKLLHQAALALCTARHASLVKWWIPEIRRCGKNVDFCCLYLLVVNNHSFQMLSNIIQLSSKCSVNESSKINGGFLPLDSKKCSNPSSVINVNFPLTNYTPRPYHNMVMWCMAINPIIVIAK